MAFQLMANESIAKGIRRIAHGQIDKALDGLTGRGVAAPEGVVHDVRKRLKRVRAVIRLARGGLGRRLADREDTRFRDAGRPLSEVRDAGVLLQAFDDLVKRYGDQGQPEVISSAHELLLSRKQEVCRRVLDQRDALAKVARVMEQARSDVKRWEVAGDDWDALEGGLKQIYRRGRRAFRETSEAPTDASLHEWRKRVKDLWYVMDILKPIRPGYTEGRGEEARRLADHLGDDHDLAVLGQVLSGSEDMPCDCASVKVILPLIDRRRADLQRNAFVLGQRIYSEPTKVFVTRLEAFWKAWTSEASAAKFDPP